MSKEIKVIFILSDDSEKIIYGKEGDTILQLAHANGLEDEIEGSCDHSLACSTCHVIVRDDFYQKTCDVSKKSYEEEDMLDLAFGVESTSRLGCQVKLTEELDGLVVRVPSARSKR